LPLMGLSFDTLDALLSPLRLLLQSAAIGA